MNNDLLLRIASYVYSKRELPSHIKSYSENEVNETLQEMISKKVILQITSTYIIESSDPHIKDLVKEVIDWELDKNCLKKEYGIIY